jgi:hypothetical protein
VDRDSRNFLTTRELDYGEKMGIDCVNASSADQSKEMKRSAIFLRLPTRADECGILEERPIRDGRGNSYEILHHDASGAEV